MDPGMKIVAMLFALILLGGCAAQTSHQTEDATSYRYDQAVDELRSVTTTLAKIHCAEYGKKPRLVKDGWNSGGLHGKGITLKCVK